MVKGITRQVYVVHSPDKKLFEQAIFILRADAPAVTDEILLQEARRAINHSGNGKKRRPVFLGPVWACGGAAVTALIWLCTTLL